MVKLNQTAHTEFKNDMTRLPMNENLQTNITRCSESEPMIKIAGLTKIYRVGDRVFKAVDDVSLSVNRSEIFGIIGLSGAGKSTLIRCINRLEEPDEGQILVDGVNITACNRHDLYEQRRDIGMIFQNFNLFQQKNVFENIAYPLRIAGRNKAEIKERVEELLDFVMLREKKFAYPTSLSGGQKQRVAIARAIATNPKVLLSDESTSALDPASTAQILDLLRKTVDVYGTSVVLITHQMEVAKDICDRIAVMENGKIIEENDVETLFRRPKTRLAQNLIKTVAVTTEEAPINASDYEGSVYRLSYDEKGAGTPVLSRCIVDCKVDINIIAGNISKVTNTSVGYLYVEILGERQNTEQAVKYLRDRGVVVQEVQHELG